uniref:NADH dehydrogenase subunit 2 n=1 Tax=Chlamydomonas moewusii TaxID=3054 RepID=O47544_CHLMO|nr:NADH dehydrogenase subunit 2 [Chlamydomonas moewusii]AAC39341.1 NADH dehydrogenase subunit 2 [Chlamydomonas moewusii]QRM91390.1 NADH dehydrogenase subunit 2 [Chlamydomonas moewusii]
MTELSLCFALILLILYGLFSMSMDARLASATIVFNQINVSKGVMIQQSSIKMVNLYLKDVYFFSYLWPMMFILSYAIDNPQEIEYYSNFSTYISSILINMIVNQYNGIDVLLIILTIIIMQGFKSFESIILLLLAFVGQIFMLHSCDFVSFYICLEAQNFVFLVLCGLQPRVLKYSSVRSSRPLMGVEASLKYLLLSAFSSGVLLFWFSIYYLKTGLTSIAWNPLSTLDNASVMDIVPQMMILIALMFKIGGAPLHIWMIDIYSGVKRQLLMYISTAPKLSLFGFWVTTWHSVYTDFSVFLFVALSMILGCFGAYNQPTLRSLFAYSTINEIGLMLMAIESAGFHSMFQHLSIYMVTMVLLWSLSDHRILSIIAISLAGLPPLAGFFGKAWIFNSVATSSMAGPYLAILLISLFCTLLSLVYYLRVFRLFTMNLSFKHNNIIYPVGVDGNVATPFNMTNETRVNSVVSIGRHIKLSAFCVLFLIFAPLFYIKPFVL